MVQPNQLNGGASKSLETRISDHKTKLQLYCDHCQRPGHWTSKCRKFEGNKCFNCGKYGHRARECRAKKRGKDKFKGRRGDGINIKGDERRTDEHSNVVDGQVTFVVNETTEDEMYNFECYDVTSINNDERMIFYDWLANSATSSHVSSQREAFATYTPIENSTAKGAGGK